MSLTDTDLPMTPYTFTGKVQPVNLAIDPTTRVEKEDLDDFRKLQASMVKSPFYGPNMEPTWYDVLRSYFCSPPKDLFPQPTEEEMAKYGWYRVSKPRFPLRAKEVMLPEEKFAAQMVEERVENLCKQMEEEKELASVAKAAADSQQSPVHESAEKKPAEELADLQLSAESGATPDILPIFTTQPENAEEIHAEESADLCAKAAPNALPKLIQKTTESDIADRSSGYFSAGTGTCANPDSSVNCARRPITPLSHDQLAVLGLSNLEGACDDSNNQQVDTCSLSTGHDEHCRSLSPPPLPPPETSVPQRQSWASRVKRAAIRFLSCCYRPQPDSHPNLNIAWDSKFLMQ